MSTYIKPSKNELTDLEINYSKGFWALIASNIHIIVNGVVLDEISKMQNVKILL
jgi:hypothetical protein